MRMLTPALRRYIRDRTLQNLEQRLLHALSADIARDGRILRAAGDLIDLIDVDDTLLRLFNIPICSLQQLEQDILHVLADIARLRQRGRICDCKRHIQNFCQCLCDQGLTGTGRSDHHDIALLQLYAVILNRGLGDTFVVIVYRNSQCLFGVVLFDDIIIENRGDLLWLRQTHRFFVCTCRLFLRIILF